MEQSDMTFKLRELARDDDVKAINRAIWRVDPDANVTVDASATIVRVDSWLMPEEFLVAFNEEGFDVSIVES
jgi:copper chaperone